METPSAKLRVLAQSLRAASFTFLLILSLYLPSFDTSHETLTSNPQGSSKKDVVAGLRWDAVHFLSIAHEGFTYEQQLAFQPLWPWVMWISGWPITLLRTWPALLRGLREDGYAQILVQLQAGLLGRDIAIGGTFLAMIASIGAVMMFYRLSKLYYPSKTAYRAAMLYCLAPTPAVLSSPYTEPFFALATFSGLYFLLTKRTFYGAACLSAASSTRATGVFMAPVAAALLLQRENRSVDVSWRLVKAALVCAVIVAPFLAFQIYAYIAFCLPPARRPWCGTGTLPYSFVQAEYWYVPPPVFEPSEADGEYTKRRNVGFLRYWTPSQIPNLVLALPVLYISLRGSLGFFLAPRRDPTLHASMPRRATPPIWPFHIHHLLMTLLLIFSSHTQIALRVIVGDPTFWWNLVDLAFKPCENPVHNTDTPVLLEDAKEPLKLPENPTGESKREGDQRAPSSGVKLGWREEDGGVECVKLTKTGQAWVYWTVLWGAISIVLWAGHYPPA